MNKDIILYESPEACTKGIAKFEDGTEFTVFHSKRGIYEYIGRSEHTARYNGSTHKTCPETGEVFGKTWVDGPAVRARKRREEYLSYKQEARDFPIFIGEDFYFDFEELIDCHCDQEEFDGLHGEILFANKGTLREVDLEDIYGDMPSECDGPDPSQELKDALEKLNEIIRKEESGWYNAITIRPTDEQLSEWEDAIRRAREKQ